MPADRTSRPTHDDTGARAADSTAPDPATLDADHVRQGHRAPGLAKKMAIGTAVAAVVLIVVYALTV